MKPNQLYKEKKRFQNKKKKIFLELNLSKIFFNRLYKDLLWKKNLFHSFITDFINKKLNFVKKIQIVSLIKRRIKNTKNNKQIISFYIFLFKIGIINSQNNFIKYNLNDKKFYEIFFFLFSSFEWEYYGSFQSSTNVLNYGLSLEKNLEFLPKEYLRIVSLFTKKIEVYLNKNNNKKNALDVYKIIKIILNQVLLSAASSIQKLCLFEYHLINFIHMFVKNLWKIYKMVSVFKLFEKLIKLKNVNIETLSISLFQNIISQLFVENIFIVKFLSEIDTFLNCINPRYININININNKFMSQPIKKKNSRILFTYIKNGKEYYTAFRHSILNSAVNYI